MIQANRQAHLHPIGAHPVILHPVSTIIMFLSVPITPLLAIYIAVYSGWLAGVVSWVGLQLIGVLAVFVLWIRSPILGLHFMLSCVALLAGLFFVAYSFTT